jgi:hypothetical protein
VEGLRTAAASTSPTWARARSILIIGAVAVAFVTVLLRLPPTLSTLSSQANRNDAWNATARTLATADSLAIDNGFAEAALQIVPSGATFAVLGPPARGTETIAPLTVEALPGYFRYLLLPRREVDVTQARYVLCYACNAQAVPHPVRWLWSEPGGLKIGQLP